MPPDALICSKFKKVEWNGNLSVNNAPVKRLTNSACRQVYMSNDHANFRTYFTKKLSAPTGSFTVYCLIYTKFGLLIFRKIIKIVATRCEILKLKCTKFDFGWGSAPDPAGGAYSAPPDPLAGFKGAYF